MTPLTAKRLKPVYDAFCAGKTVQWRRQEEKEWCDYNAVTTTISFLHHNFEWRVKPEPRELVLARARLHHSAQWGPWMEVDSMNHSDGLNQTMRVREVLE